MGDEFKLRVASNHVAETGPVESAGEGGGLYDLNIQPHWDRSNLNLMK